MRNPRSASADGPGQPPFSASAATTWAAQLSTAAAGAQPMPLSPLSLTVALIVNQPALAVDVLAQVYRAVRIHVHAALSKQGGGVTGEAVAVVEAIGGPPAVGVIGGVGARAGTTGPSVNDGDGARVVVPVEVGREVHVVQAKSHVSHNVHASSINITQAIRWVHRRSALTVQAEVLLGCAMSRSSAPAAPAHLLCSPLARPLPHLPSRTREARTEGHPRAARGVELGSDSRTTARGRGKEGVRTSHTGIETARDGEGAEGTGVSAMVAVPRKAPPNPYPPPMAPAAPDTMMLRMEPVAASAPSRATIAPRLRPMLPIGGATTEHTLTQPRSTRINSRRPRAPCHTPADPPQARPPAYCTRRSTQGQRPRPTRTRTGTTEP